jgi:hypothetical protein
MAGKIKSLLDAGAEVANLIRLGFLKEESANNPAAVKSARTKYEKTLQSSPAVRRREEQRLAGETLFTALDIGERNILEPESLLDYTLVPVFGDKTAIGEVSRLRGLELDVPVETHGGVDFSQRYAGTGRGYMSMSDAAKRKQANFDFAADQTDTDKVAGVYTAGADPSFNFATPIAELMYKQTKAAGVPKKSAAEFDQELRKIRPDWVGLNDPRALDQLMGTGDFQRKGSGALRIDFIDTMNKAKYRDMGFGVRRDAVEAVTRPGLENIARGDSGFGVMKAVPGGKTYVEDDLHQSYDTVLLGDYFGGLQQSLPANVMFPDTFRWMQAQGRSPSSQLGSLMMDPKLYQKADESWLEGINRYLKTGKPDVEIQSNPLASLAAIKALEESRGLLARLPQKDTASYNYSEYLPIKRSLDPEERQGFFGGYSPAFTGVPETLVRGLLELTAGAKTGTLNQQALFDLLL